ncbi:MAG: 50S ribosomal protein L21 [Proteobacteria bacterium]|nr:50S ribosomal protein L21 [Pseudomonadota bacterium]MDA1355436.1 50S ribosomal protein L21 [Pseudomonadota bacterium]
MFAVIKTGGKQYRVSPRDVIRVERLSSPAGEVIELTDVLAMGRDDGLKLGQPLVEGARVAATVLEHSRADKILVFHKQRRKNFRRTQGHRQNQTVLRIEEILAQGETFTPPPPAPEKKPAKKQASVKKVTKSKAAGDADTKSAAKPRAKGAVAKKPAAKKSPAKKSPAEKSAADKSQDEETS